MVEAASSQLLAAFGIQTKKSDGMGHWAGGRGGEDTIHGDNELLPTPPSVSDVGVGRSSIHGNVTQFPL